MSQSDAVQLNYRDFEWLGLDLKLVDGDLAFDVDGDLLMHTDPIESFCAALKHLSQIEANLVYDANNPMLAVHAALHAIEGDPRVARVKLTNTRWGTDTSLTVIEVTLDITLATGSTLQNMVLPISFLPRAA